MGVGRGCARLFGMTLLLTAAVSLLITTLSQPTFNKFEFVTAYYLNGPNSPEVIETLKLGMWGYCIETPGQGTFCPPSKLGFLIDNEAYLPPFVVPYPDPTLRQLMNFKLAGALLLIPLSFGQILLTLTACLIPIRFFTLVALLFSVLSFGITLLSGLIVCLVYVPVKDRIQTRWSTSVSTTLSVGMWLIATAVVCTFFAQFLLWMAVIPKKERKARPLTYQERDIEDDYYEKDDPAKSFRTKSIRSGKSVERPPSKTDKLASPPTSQEDSSPLSSPPSKYRPNLDDRKSSRSSGPISYVENGKQKVVQESRYEESEGVYRKY